MLNDQEILRYMGRQPKHTAGFKQLAHDLAIKGRERRGLESLLKELTRQRKLVAIGKDRWALPTASSSLNLVAGRLHMHRDGYGFVTPEPDSLPPRARGKLQGDIFVRPPDVGTAMHGDRVLVELGAIRQDGRAEGRILTVTERKQETIVGIFHYGSRQNYVTPMNERVTMDILIPPGMEFPAGPQADAQSQAAPPSRQ
ncbi:MAG TPA: ribonuclease R, partial [Candidatus Angelobacter sp.]